MPDRASSKGCTIQQVEILSNKLLTTAFEASLGCVAVMRRAKRRQRGSRVSGVCGKAARPVPGGAYSERGASTRPNVVNYCRRCGQFLNLTLKDVRRKK